MKNIFLVSLLTILSFNLNAQKETIQKIEHGLLFSSRIDSNEDFAFQFSFQVNGFGLEAGYYLLKPITKKGILSVDFRFAYSQSERTYTNLLSVSDSFFSYSTYLVRSGNVDYESLSFSIPIKFRYKFSLTSPIFVLAGVNPYFNIWNKANWKYDEFENDILTGVNISERGNYEKNLKQNLFGRDIILLGIGYKKEKMMFDIYFSGGAINLQDDFLARMDKLSIVLNLYYRLN